MYQVFIEVKKFTIHKSWNTFISVYNSMIICWSLLYNRPRSYNVCMFMCCYCMCLTSGEIKKVKMNTSSLFFSNGKKTMET